MTYFSISQNGEITVTDEGKQLLKKVNLKELSQKHAGFKSPAVFHQRVNGYIIGENKKPGFFSISLLNKFVAALDSYLVEVDKLNDLYNEAVEILKDSVVDQVVKDPIESTQQ